MNTAAAKVAIKPWQAILADMACAVADEAHQRMMRTANGRLYLAYTPAQDGDWGALRVVGEDAELPADYIYATPEPIAQHLSADQLKRQFCELCRTLPLIGD